MDLNGYLAELRDSLAAATRSSSESVRQVALDLGQTLEPSLRLALMELASDIASQVTCELDGDVVEVRLRGGRPEIVVQRAPRAAEPAEPDLPAPPVPAPPPVADDPDGTTARVSLRLPESLKERVEDAAARDGVSVNTWLVRAAQTELNRAQPTTAHAPTSTARRMSGWAR